MFGTSTIGIEWFVLSILAILVLIICVWCIYAFFHAIFLFIFSQWDEEKKKSAWNSIRYMIIWVILTIALLTVFPLAFRQLEITWYETYTASNIFQRAWEILNGILQLGKISENPLNSGGWYNNNAPSPSQDYSL
jgi:uncharacterized membrane protein